MRARTLPTLRRAGPLAVAAALATFAFAASASAEPTATTPTAKPATAPAKAPAASTTKAPATPTAKSAGAAPAAGEGEKNAWLLLGTRHVTDKLDHDTIAVTVKEGTFTKLQVRVVGSAVQFHSMKVHFGNGETQDVDLKDVIKPGHASKGLDLPGAARVIKTVDFVYDAQTIGKKGATVRLFGRH